MTEKGMKKLVP